MEARIEEGDADACSRLAWLCRHLREEERAVHWAKKGLEKDPDNWHCRGFLGKKRG